MGNSCLIGQGNGYLHRGNTVESIFDEVRPFQIKHLGSACPQPRPLDDIELMVTTRFRSDRAVPRQENEVLCVRITSLRISTFYNSSSCLLTRVSDPRLIIEHRKPSKTTFLSQKRVWEPFSDRPEQLLEQPTQLLRLYYLYLDQTCFSG